MTSLSAKRDISKIICKLPCFNNLKLIGTGGYGNVYEGVSQQKKYAIKISHALNKDFGASDFYSTNKYLEQLNHRNLVTTHHIDLISYGKEYFSLQVMDSMTGFSISKPQFERNRVKLSQIIPQLPVDYWDLRPSNILFSNSRFVFIDLPLFDMAGNDLMTYLKNPILADANITNKRGPNDITNI